jgi:dipeptidyl aminopeptidase/acylaminoacyl peptidase
VAPDGGAAPELLFDRSTEDRYNDPGTPITERNQYGRSALLTSTAGDIYLSGAGASAEGDRPFLDRLNLASKTSERLWRSEAPSYASFVEFLDSDQHALLIRQESPTAPGNYFRLDLNSTQQTALTTFPHPYPHMLDVYKEVVRYRRDDGVMLTATLYLPPGKTKEDGPFPMLMWAYPREFKDASSAGQMRGSPYRFNAISVNGPLPFLAPPCQSLVKAKPNPMMPTWSSWSAAPLPPCRPWWKWELRSPTRSPLAATPTAPS